MLINVYSLSIFFSIAFLIIVVELVRKNKLQERYSLLWIFMSIIVLVLSISPVFIEILAKWLDIKNPPSLLFLFGLIYLLIYNLHITTVISKQSEKITRLAQHLALLEEKFNNTDGEYEKLNEK
ncbi:MAG TPA: DUF2304 domain-containing protein [Clostridiaceae bacterium]|nr:DUF2304 domain-containing protein [Clostridiaceae bacterium]